jgi:ubiquinone/menaquinone biosynthesis C-methylase UbiE
MNSEEYKPRYANWVSSKIVLILLIVFLLLLLGAKQVVSFSRVLSVVMMFAAFAVLIVDMLFLRARTALSYEGGGMQRKVLESVLDQAKDAGWNGRGKLLDIGCGSGALGIMAARREPKVMVTGIDLWRSHWDASQAQCEANAEAEGVASRVTFRQEDAAKLPFTDHTFDIAVSTMAFHEVRTQKDKKALVQEALRVIKPGGIFVFQDTLYNKRVYGDVDAFVKALEPYVAEIHLIDTRKPDGAPKYLTFPCFLGSTGIIWGRVKE